MGLLGYLIAFPYHLLPPRYTYMVLNESPKRWLKVHCTLQQYQYQPLMYKQRHGDYRETEKCPSPRMRDLKAKTHKLYTCHGSHSSISCTGGVWQFVLECHWKDALTPTRPQHCDCSRMLLQRSHLCVCGSRACLHTVAIKVHIFINTLIFKMLVWSK